MAMHWHRRTIAAELHPDDPILNDGEWESEMRRTNPLWDTRRWIAFDGPEAIGTASAWFRRAGTPDAGAHASFLNCYGSVSAPARRKGVGTQLLKEIHALMHSLDKKVLTMSAHTDPGHAFLLHFGAVAKHCMLEYRANLAGLDWPRLIMWEEGVQNLGLVWERYGGRVPRPVLMSLLPTINALFADMPIGSLEAAPHCFDIDDYDRWYEFMDRSQSTHHLILLRDPAGMVAAISDASWSKRNPSAVFLHFTGVARPWRGRGLARSIKAAMLGEVHACHPEAREVRTANAETNAPILAVNQHLGFNMGRRAVDYQVSRTELDSQS